MIPSTAQRVKAEGVNTRTHHFDSADSASEPPPQTIRTNEPTFGERASTHFASLIDERQSNLDTANVRQLAGKGSPPVALVAEWQGRVISIHPDHFVAEMTGLQGTNIRGSLDEALIPIEDVQNSDMALLREGALFRLCISYQETAIGRRVRCTDVVFRRLPAYQLSELEAADSRARYLSRRLRVE